MSEDKIIPAKDKRLRIVGHCPYRIEITETTCDVNFEKNNENNLAGLLISGIVLEEIMIAIAATNCKTDKQKRLRQAKLKKYKALYESLSEAVGDVCTYIFDTKSQADYDKINEKYEGKKKSKIEVVKDVTSILKKI